MIEWLMLISLILPLLLSGLSLIFILKRGWLVKLDMPLDQGVFLGGKRIFGDNKTYRGILTHVFVCISICFVLYLGYAAGLSKFIHPVFNNSPILIGLIYSLSYTLGELINSFIKRQMGISSGVFSNSKYNYLQKFFDLSDGIIIVAVVLYLFNFIAFSEAIVAGFIGISFHFLTDMFMERLKLKQKS